MNFPLSAPILPELEQVLTNLFTNLKCNCHFINPSKTRILLWKETKGETIIYHLRIGIQKFISQEQLDRNGEIYWKFNLPEKEPAEVKETTTEPTDPITKFQQRQAKTAEMNNHEQANEPAVNNQSD